MEKTDGVETADGVGEKYIGYFSTSAYLSYAPITIGVGSVIDMRWVSKIDGSRYIFSYNNSYYNFVQATASSVVIRTSDSTTYTIPFASAVSIGEYVSFSITGLWRSDLTLTRTIISTGETEEVVYDSGAFDTLILNSINRRNYTSQENSIGSLYLKIGSDVKIDMSLENTFDNDGSVTVTNTNVTVDDHTYTAPATVNTFALMASRIVAEGDGTTSNLALTTAIDLSIDKSFSIESYANVVASAPLFNGNTFYGYLDTTEFYTHIQNWGLTFGDLVATTGHSYKIVLSYTGEVDGADNFTATMTDLDTLVVTTQSKTADMSGEADTTDISSLMRANAVPSGEKQWGYKITVDGVVQGHWPLEGTLYDTSGNDNHLTNTGVDLTAIEENFTEGVYSHLLRKGYGNRDEYDAMETTDVPVAYFNTPGSTSQITFASTLSYVEPYYYSLTVQFRIHFISGTMGSCIYGTRFYDSTFQTLGQAFVFDSNDVVFKNDDTWDVEITSPNGSSIVYITVTNVETGATGTTYKTLGTTGSWTYFKLTSSNYTDSEFDLHSFYMNYRGATCIDMDMTDSSNSGSFGATTLTNVDFTSHTKEVEALVHHDAVTNAPRLDDLSGYAVPNSVTHPVDEEYPALVSGHNMAPVPVLFPTGLTGNPFDRSNTLIWGDGAREGDTYDNEHTTLFYPENLTLKWIAENLVDGLMDRYYMATSQSGYLHDGGVINVDGTTSYPIIDTTVEVTKMMSFIVYAAEVSAEKAVSIVAYEDRQTFKEK